MSLAYFPFYPSDYEAKTAHLSLEEDGAYNRLLRLCWMTPGCSIPDEREWIIRRLRITPEAFDTVVSVVIAEFFKRRRGRLYSPRLMEVFEETNRAHKRRVNAGKKGGRPRKSLENNETEESNAKALGKQPEPEPDTDKEPTANAVGKKKSSRAVCQMPDDWVLTKALGEWAVSQGFTPDEVRAEASKFETHHRAKGSRFKAWDLAWKKWIGNAKEYRAEKRRGGEGKPYPGETRIIDGVLKCYEPSMGGWQVMHA